MLIDKYSTKDNLNAKTHGTIEVEEALAVQRGLKNGDVRQFRISIVGKNIGGNAHQRRIRRRLAIRKTVIVPMTIYIQPSIA